MKFADALNEIAILKKMLNNGGNEGSECNEED